LAKVPACKVAVNPGTPVDEIALPVVNAIPLPPVYPIVAVPLNSVFAVGAAD